MGRPTKLTPETHDAIVNAVRRGNYIETAAALAGVSKVTLYKWLRQGARAKSGAFRAFTLAVRQAQAIAEDEDVAAIRDAGQDPKHWAARAWRLERRFPAKWGKREKLTSEVSGPNGKAIEIKATDYRAAIAALAPRPVGDSDAPGEDQSDLHG